jgi:hypothetical protein
MENCPGWCHERYEKNQVDPLNFPKERVLLKILTTKIKINLLLICILAPCVKASAQDEKEKDAIKAVITNETISFMNVDRKAWSDTWLKAPYAYWSYSDSTGSSFLDGWETIQKTFDEYFRTQKPSQAKITNEWIDLRLYGNGAYARFIQRTQDEIDIDETSQVRVLEKQDGKWKVVCVGAVAMYPKK